MAGGLYNRVQARGFPSWVAAGYTGEGALASQGSTADPAHGQNVWGPPTSTLPGFQQEGPPDPAVLILEGAIGLPGEVIDPDQTPGYGPGTFRTHAAPAPGWAGSYQDYEALEILHSNSAQIHAQNFGSPLLSDAPDDVTVLPMNPWSSNTPELTGVPNPQVPLTGGQRVLGGMDAVQGYDLRNDYGFDAGHRYRPEITGNVVNAFLDSAERPFIVPQASGSFTPTDAVWGPEPWSSDLNAQNVNYTDPSAFTPGPAPATMQGQLTEAVASAGWR